MVFLKRCKFTQSPMFPPLYSNGKSPMILKGWEISHVDRLYEREVLK